MKAPSLLKFAVCFSVHACGANEFVHSRSSATNTPSHRPDPAEGQATGNLLEAAAADLVNRVDAAGRAQTRYLFFPQAPANPQVAAAAVSRLLNSLSLAPAVIRIEAIGQEKQLFRLNLTALGWDKNAWDEIEKRYPYARTYRDDRFFRLLQDRGGAQVPIIRADWFIANASLPPLYYKLLKLPGKLDDLSKGLGFSFAQNYAALKIVRAGIIESGVSENPRIIEEHKTKQGFLWRSYEFAAAPTDIAANLADRPLGPAGAFAPVTGNRRGAFEFHEQGNEVIFNLANGFLAYFVADQSGRRLSEAPDVKAEGQTLAVKVGLTCMSCHKSGLINPPPAQVDGFRQGAAKFPAFFRDIYPESSKLFAVVAEGNGIFQNALAQLQLDDAADKDPVNEVAEIYGQNLTASEAAAELGLPRESLLNGPLQPTAAGVVPNGLALFLFELATARALDANAKIISRKNFSTNFAAILEFFRAQLVPQ